jgi:hypothetical protein
MLAAGVRPTARACGTILSALGDCLHAGGRAGEGAGAVSGGKTTAVRKLNADQTEALERALDLLGSMPEWVRGATRRRASWHGVASRRHALRCALRCVALRFALQCGARACTVWGERSVPRPR